MSGGAKDGAGEDLPPGVEPWAGEELPLGRTSIAPLGEGVESPEAELAQAGHTNPAPERAAKESMAPPEVSARGLFARTFALLSVDERVSLGRQAKGEDLLALCFDSDPRVVAAVLENDEFSPGLARALARHHRSARGLEILSRHRLVLTDREVERQLLRNPQLPAEALSRMVRARPLREVYKWTVERELPERVRTLVRAELKRKFGEGESEEKVDLLVRTEGRALQMLAGCGFDQRTAQLLASRTLTSVMFVQNLARFGATPPNVLLKLAKSPLVVRQPQLLKMLLQHPNMPKDRGR